MTYNLTDLNADDSLYLGLRI